MTDNPKPILRRGSAVTTCRVCGCSQNDACFDKKRGHGCHWVQAKLCNVCDEKAKAIKITVSMRDTLRELAGKRAFDRRSARLGADTGLRHSGALQKRGLIETEYARTVKRMVYWTTPLGREVARRAS